jgi:plastocyanin
VQLFSAARTTLALGLVAAATLGVSSVSSAAQTLTVSAGAESAGGGDVQLNAFAPKQVTISVGDTVTWSLDSTEFHNVLFTSGAPGPEFVQPGPDGVFINPVVAMPSGGTSYDGSGMAGSGLMVKGQTFSLTFSKAGSYQYVCSIHPGMEGTVRVVDGNLGVDSQAGVDIRRTSEVNAGLASSIPLVFANRGELPTAPTATLGVAVGVQHGAVDSLRFLPGRVTVHKNESVNFIWRTEDTPHTVTFLAGNPAPEVIVPEPQASGPPRLRLAPATLMPAGSAIDWDGASLLHSGFRAPIPGQPAPEFGVRFTSVGTFDFLCVLHEGMVGTVVVLPD